MKIRVATELDKPELRRIFFETRLKSFMWEDKEKMKLEDFDKFTEGESVLLAETDSVVTGFISLVLAENFIHNLFVDSNFAGKGIGGQLVNVAVEKMNKPVQLKCVSKNHNALKFYLNSGWKKIVEEGKPNEKYWVMEYE